MQFAASALPGHGLDVFRIQSSTGHDADPVAGLGDERGQYLYTFGSALPSARAQNPLGSQFDNLLKCG